MSEEMSEAQVAEARRIANEIWQILIVPHERDEHNGESCLTNRVGTIAYFAHVVGLKPGHLPLFAEILAEYEASHTHRHNGDS